MFFKKSYSYLLLSVGQCLTVKVSNWSLFQRSIQFYFELFLIVMNVHIAGIKKVCGKT